MRTLIVIPCGAAKLSSPVPAAALYTGGYFRACLEFARDMAAADAGALLVILSAKYGFVELTRTIPPYNVTWGSRAAITLEQLAGQLELLERRGAFDRVQVLGGRRYVAMVRAVRPTAAAVIPELAGIGYQLQWLKRNRPAVAL